MKKLLTAVVALALILAFTVSALATTLYVNEDPGKVYKKNSKKSDVISRLPYGGSVEVIETDGKWVHISYLNKDRKERSGWMLLSTLSEAKPCKHEWGKWKVTKKATCAKAGKKERTCSICGKVQKKETKKADHKWGKWTVVREATCAKAGEQTHKCTVCGKKETKSIARSAHSFGEWSVVRQASCAAAGEQSRVCTTCGFKETGTIDRLPHTFGEWSTLAALTRDNDGERSHVCAVCGFEERVEVKAEPAFARGDRGDGVRAAQRMLNDLGYDAGSADGVYGPKLDKAFGAFAQDSGVYFQSGQLRPSQLDALVNGWIAGLPQSSWMGEGDLILTVTPTDMSGGVRTFNWTLTNNGAEPCTLDALLMGVGADHDFKADDVVVALDGETLKARGGNTLSGSFSVPAELSADAEALTFRALAASDKTGARWLSNEVVQPVGE